MTLKIPAGSQTGRHLRLKGRGLPGSPPGDQYAVLNVVLPPADTEADKTRYREMAQSMDFDLAGPVDLGQIVCAQRRFDSWCLVIRNLHVLHISGGW